MTREKFFCLSLSRFAQASAAALITMVLAGAAGADTIKDFNVFGSATNESGVLLGTCAAGALCHFSGTMMVDLTNGSITAVDITFPGLTTFNEIFTSAAVLNLWNLTAFNLGQEFEMSMFFTTTPTEGSLVNFAGGSMFPFLGTVQDQYTIVSGRISPVPEPSSLGLMVTGVLGLAGMMRRKLRLGT